MSLIQFIKIKFGMVLNRKMKVIVAKNLEDAYFQSGKIIINHLKNNQANSIGFATGSTMVPVYKFLTKSLRKYNLSNIRTFSLDEYIGLSSQHPLSFSYYMYEHLFNQLSFHQSNINLLDGSASNIEKEAQNYEKIISLGGGIDLQLLGVGRNGHIGFNEPGSKFDSVTRVVNLDNSTIKTNSQFFHNFNEVPRTAITMGIGTILKAKKLLVVATGKEKAIACKKMINEAPTVLCPASAIQAHSNVTVILDQSAASLL